MKQVTWEPLGDPQFVFPPTFRSCSVRETVFGFAISSTRMAHIISAHERPEKPKSIANRYFESHFSQLRASDEAAIASGTLVDIMLMISMNLGTKHRFTDLHSSVVVVRGNCRSFSRSWLRSLSIHNCS